MQQKWNRNTARGTYNLMQETLYIGRKPIWKNRKENFKLIKSGESRSDVCPLFFSIHRYQIIRQRLCEDSET